MPDTNDRLDQVFSKTSGYCAYWEKQLAGKNYGTIGARGAWEVDQSIPVSRGGTEHLHNLVPACVDCNRLKADMTGCEFRTVLETNPPEHGMSSGDPVVAALAAGGILYILRELGDVGGGRPGPGGEW